MIDPSFFVFCDALYEELPFGGPGVKFLLMSAFSIIRLPDDVIVTSRDVIMSDVGFFGLESFLSSLPDYWPSLKSIE